MDHILRAGIPSISEYRSLVETKGFKSLECYSDEFLSTNEEHLRAYMQKWVKDPLHQWSRQWEYPYVYENAKAELQTDQETRVLDAGSGVTFFSYYLNSEFESIQVHACDYDKTLLNTYAQINQQSNQSVEFAHADLRSLPYDNDWFDLVYCISVLEHTDEYETIIKEFSRVLRPGGKLIVTFDVSLDGRHQIAVGKGTKLLAALAREFEVEPSLSLDLESHVVAPTIFTTLTANEINPALLPWKSPSSLSRIKSMLTPGAPSSWPPALTVFCLEVTKASNEIEPN